MFETIITVHTEGHDVALVAYAESINEAEAAGVNIERLLAAQSNTVAQATEMAGRIMCSGAVELIVISGKMAACHIARVRELAERSGVKVVTS